MPLIFAIPSMVKLVGSALSGASIVMHSSGGWIASGKLGYIAGTLVLL